MFQQKHGSDAGGKKIEFVRRDTTGPNPEVAKRLAQELIVREKVQILIGPDFTPNVLAVAPLVTEAKVPTIIIGAATSGIIGEKSPYLMRTFFAIPQVVHADGAMGRQERHEEALRGGRRLRARPRRRGQLHEAFAEAGRHASPARLRVPLRNPEFSSYMQRIKDAEPDAVFVFMPIGELSVQFLKAYADSGLKDSKLKLLGTGDMTDESAARCGRRRRAGRHHHGHLLRRARLAR